MPHSDADDLARWRRHRDPRAFQRIIDRYSGLVFGAGRRITRNVEDAEDITQKSFLKLAESPPSIKYSLGGWLHRVATNLAINDIGREHRRKTREQKYQSLSSVSDEAVWDDLQDMIDEAIEQLPNKFKEPLIAHYLGGQTFEVIAKQMGVSRQTVSYRIGKGVEHIRKFLRHKGQVVGAAALASTLQGLTTEPVPAALAQSLSKLALSGIGTPAAGQLGRFGDALDILNFGSKPMRWLSLAAVVIGASAGFMWASKPAEVQGASEPVTVEPRAQRDALLTVGVASDLVTEEPTLDTEATLVAFAIDQNSQSPAGAGQEDTEEIIEEGRIKVNVIEAISGRPVPDLRVDFYPKDAVDFVTESDEEIPDVDDLFKEEIRSIRNQVNLTPLAEGSPWYLSASIMRMVKDPGARTAFYTDGSGTIVADTLHPGEYIVVIESNDFGSAGELSIELKDAGTAAISGGTYIMIADHQDPQELVIKAVRKGVISGRIQERNRDIGIPGMRVFAYLSSDNAYVKTIEAETTTDQAGRFSLSGLLPGRYEIRRDRGEGLHGQTSVEVTLAPGEQRQDVDFPVMTAGAALTGTVYWGAEPVANMPFDLFYAHVEEDLSKTQAIGTKVATHSLETDENGQYFVLGVREIRGVIYGGVTMENGDTRVSDWERNVYLSNGDYRTVDIRFRLGTGSIEGRLTRGGRPVHKSRVIWYPKEITGAEMRTLTDEEGWYRFDDVDAGDGRVIFYFPRTYEAVNRAISLGASEVLVLDVDMPANAIQIRVHNIPENMKNAWVYIGSGPEYLPIGMSYRKWSEMALRDALAMSRIFRQFPVRIRGIEPGSYTLVAISYPALGFIGSYLDDPQVIEEYLEGSVVIHKNITIEEESNSALEINFSDGEPASKYFTSDLE